MAVQTSQGTLGDAAPAAGQFPANHAYFVREFIDIANPMLVYDKFGTPKPIPNNSSNTITFNKVAKLATLENNPLTEGVTPAEQDFTMVRLSQTVNQYGAYARVSDRLHEESVNELTSEFNQRTAEQGGETMNKVLRDDLLGGINVRYAGGVADQDSIAGVAMPFGDLDYMYQALKLEKVKPPRMMTMGSQNVGTAPSRAVFPVVVAVEAIPLIEALDDGKGNVFQSVETYAGQVQTWDEEHGRFKNFAFILDTESNIETNGVSGLNINQSLVFGKGAYHHTTIGASDLELIIKPKGSAGTADPLNQRSSIGWKAKKAAVIVQETYMFRYEFAVS